MKLFDITLGNQIDGSGELFVKGGEQINGGIATGGGTASFETYFNLLPHAKYREYCGLNGAELHLDAEGEYTVHFYLRKLSGERVCLAEHGCSGRCALPLPFPEEGGYLFFEVTGECKIFGGSWQARPENTRRVKIAVVICTYRREQFVLANLKKIGEGIESGGEWAERLHVYVIDNAGTLDKSGISGVPADVFEIVKNRNLGGSGGFARGIYEADNNGTFTHILLMDDDVSFDFALLKRTWSLLSCLTERHSEAAVGGAMLVMENPVLQYEFGGRFDGLVFKSLNGGLDMRETGSLIKNERAPVPNYNAWWYCCMPVSCVAEHGLPLPFFIKGDDVEYGLRCIRELILLNGIGIWHQDFSKKYNSALEFYLKRNQLVINALHFSAAKSHPALVFLYSVLKQLSLKNYEAAEVILRAYEDFFKGPQFFIETDPERLNAEILRFRPKELTREELAANCGSEILQLLDSPEKKKTSSIYKRALAMLENFVPGFFFRNKPRVFDTVNIQPNQTFLVRRCIYFKPDTESGILCELDTKRRRTIRRRTYRIFFKLLFRYKKMRRNYCHRAAELYSAAEWKKKFEQ